MNASHPPGNRSTSYVTVIGRRNAVRTLYLATNETSQKFPKIVDLIFISSRGICGENDFGCQRLKKARLPGRKKEPFQVEMYWYALEMGGFWPGANYWIIAETCYIFHDTSPWTIIFRHLTVEGRRQLRFSQSFYYLKIFSLVRNRFWNCSRLRHFWCIILVAESVFRSSGGASEILARWIQGFLTPRFRECLIPLWRKSGTFKIQARFVRQVLFHSERMVIQGSDKTLRGEKGSGILLKAGKATLWFRP